MESGSGGYIFARYTIGLAIMAAIGFIITCNGMANAPEITWRHWLLLAFSLACALEVAVLVGLNGAETISVRRMLRDLTVTALAGLLGIAVIPAFFGHEMLPHASALAAFIVTAGLGAILAVHHVRRATVVAYEVDGLTYRPGWRPRELRLLATLPPGHRVVGGEVLSEEGGRVSITVTAERFRFRQPSGDPAEAEATVMLGRPLDDRIVVDRTGRRIPLAQTDQQSATAAEPAGDQA